jgi:hypothetical protein
MRGPARSGADGDGRTARAEPDPDLTVTYQRTSGTYTSTTQTESCQTTGPLSYNSGCFVGPYTTGFTIAGWTVPFAPISIDHAAGQFSSLAPPSSLLVAGTATINGQYYDGEGDPVKSCQASAAVSVDPASEPAAMSIAVGGAQSFSWTGQIVLEPKCGTITVTPGDGGDQTSVTLGPGQGVDADFDGTVYDFGGGTQVEQDADGGMSADPDCFSFVPLPAWG